MQVKIDTAIFFELWKDKEKSLGKPLNLTDAAQITKLAPETIRKIREGKTTRFDAPVIAKLCQLLDLPPGPVPFIVYDEGSTSENQSFSVLRETQAQLSSVSPLGRELRAIRERAIAGGMKTLSQTEIEQELAVRRGERT